MTLRARTRKMRGIFRAVRFAIAHLCLPPHASKAAPRGQCYALAACHAFCVILLRQGFAGQTARAPKISLRSGVAIAPRKWRRASACAGSTRLALTPALRGTSPRRAVFENEARSTCRRLIQRPRVADYASPRRRKCGSLRQPARQETCHAGCEVARLRRERASWAHCTTRPQALRAVAADPGGNAGTRPCGRSGRKTTRQDRAGATIRRRRR